MAPQQDAAEQAGADYRIEHDSMGEVRVPGWAKWRAQTQRAVENFPISGTPIERELIGALAAIKGAAATVNADLGVLDGEIAVAISEAAASVARGEWDEHFPIDVFQTGSGTSSNMNTNEVIATLATEALGKPVHPNDHVNASQSSNDVFPSAIHVAATGAIVRDLIPALQHLELSLSRKADEFADVVKSGRTHLMDATPVTLGQEFGGYAAAVRYGVERLRASLPRIGELPLGGTAVGTGINTPPGFAAAIIERLAGQLDLPLTEARDHFEAQSSRDGLVEASGQLKTIAVGLVKIANDLRWMGSGPRTGLGEINPARPPARQLDHAGQGEPGDPGGDHPGGRPGHRQRRRGDLRRHDRQLRAQRDAAADGPQRAGVDPAAGQRQPDPGRPHGRRDHRERGAAAASWPSPRPRSSRR